jgi:hypothetical protein
MALAVISTLVSTPVAAQGKVEIKPMHVGANMYFGQMFNIDTGIADVGNFNSTVTIPMTSLWMIQQATVEDRLELNLGIVGSFFYPFPEDNIAGYKSYRTGGFGILQANANYRFGDLAKPWLQFTIGQQGYKYNPYAKNFGEYLFRSEAYPTIVRTGDWGAIDNASAGIWGAAFKTQFADGLISNDFIISMSDTRVPLYDMSLTDVVNLKIGKVFQIGAGVMLNRYIQFDPTKSRPEKKETGWIDWTAADQQRLSAYVNKYRAAKPGALDTNSTETYNRLLGANRLPDTLVATGTYWAFTKRPILTVALDPDTDTIASVEKRALIDNLEINYIESKTIYAMGRFSIDPKSIFGLEDALGPQDLVLYGEASIIGFNNFPIYYRSIKERMPMMLGFNFPTFKFLDFLALEVEYMKNPHLNSDFITANFRHAQPKSLDHAAKELPDIADPLYDFDGQRDINHTDDDFKWTLTAQKSFGYWNLAGQVGKDHYRPLDPAFRPSLTEAATTSDAWYYMLRLMVNL